MTIEVIDSRRNHYVLEDVEGRIQSLNEIVEKIVIRVSAVMKVGAERGLPLLSLQDPARIDVPAVESFEVIFANAPVFRTRRKLCIDRVSDDIGAIDETNFRIEIWPDSVLKKLKLHQVAVIARVKSAGPIMTA